MSHNVFFQVAKKASVLKRRKSRLPKDDSANSSKETGVDVDEQICNNEIGDFKSVTGMF